MKPLILLVTVFTAAVVFSRCVLGVWNVPFAGSLAMCLMLFLTAAGHFMFPKGMALMMPPVIPFKTALIYGTGVLEVLLGVALLFPALRPAAGWVLIAFFVLILPANIYGAMKHVNLEKATYTGPGLGYLWFRVPEQVFFIAWLYFLIRTSASL